MASRDDEHRYVHRVSIRDIERFKQGKIVAMLAACGKEWAPTVFQGDTHQIKECEFCFSPLLKQARAF